MNDLSWRWIAVMIVAPVPVAMLVAMPLWRRGEGIPIAFTEAEVAAARVDTLELSPVRAGPAPAGQ